MRIDDLHWLAGYLEGEGSFVAGGNRSPESGLYGTICICVSSTDRDVIERVAELFGNNKVYNMLTHTYVGSFPNRKPQFRAQLGGDPAVRLMLELRPLLGERRKHQIGKAILNCHRFRKALGV